MSVTSEEIKACCAATYLSAAARFLLGDSFHPGGAELTSRLVRALRVGRGDLVVDVACGLGTSARQLAAETGCDVVGIDLSPPPDSPGESRVRFVRGDAEALLLEDASIDGALCECAFCTFPDKARAAAELARVLRPGARLALSDMTARTSELPASLTTLQAWAACIADARPIDEIVVWLEGAGLMVEQAERQDDALTSLLDRVEARLKVATMLGAEGVALGRELAVEARAAVEQGVLGYSIVIAQKR